MSDRALEPFRDPGRWRRPLRPIGRLLRLAFHTRRHLLLAYDLTGPLPTRQPRLPVQFRAATPSEVEAIGEDPRHELSAEGRRVHARMLQEGARCTLGIVEGAALYHGWCARGRWRVAGEVSLPLAADTAVIFRCFTAREIRGRGVYGAALAHELARLAAEGFRRALINVEERNAVSRRVIASIGFVPLGTYRVTCIAGVVRVSFPEGLKGRLPMEGAAAAPR